GGAVVSTAQEHGTLLAQARELAQAAERRKQEREIDAHRLRLAERHKQFADAAARLETVVARYRLYCERADLDLSLAEDAIRLRGTLASFRESLDKDWRWLLADARANDMKGLARALEALDKRFEVARTAAWRTFVD